MDKSEVIRSLAESARPRRIPIYLVDHMWRAAETGWPETLRFGLLLGIALGVPGASVVGAIALGVWLLR